MSNRSKFPTPACSGRAAKMVDARGWRSAIPEVVPHRAEVGAASRP